MIVHWKLLGLIRAQQIYEKSLERRRGCPKFIFYEGPPTANGMPHPGHCLTRAIKDLFPRYRKRADFIQRYIFPGGFLPSVTALCEVITGHSQMRLFHLEDIGPHYATTLRHWRERFQARLDQVRALGYGEAFIRMWEFYLCYCEGGFLERSIGTVQMLLVKPDCRRPPLTPSLQEPSVGRHCYWPPTAAAANNPTRK